MQPDALPGPGRQDRDLLALARRIKFRGVLEADPDQHTDGHWWIRKDLDPKELRVSVGGSVYKVGLNAA